MSGYNIAIYVKNISFANRVPFNWFKNASHSQFTQAALQFAGNKSAGAFSSNNAALCTGADTGKARDRGPT